MKTKEIFLWWLPPDIWRKTERLSRYRMDAQESASRGALRPYVTSRMVIQVPESGAEERQLRRELELGPSTMKRPWWMKPEMIQLEVREVGWVAGDAMPELLELPVREVRWVDDYWWPGRVAL
jgi:hypothetical protein